MITSLPYTPLQVVRRILKVHMLSDDFETLTITEEPVADVELGRDGKIRARRAGEWTVNVAAPRELEVTIAQRRLVEEGYDVERIGKLLLRVKGNPRC